MSRLAADRAALVRAQLQPGGALELLGRAEVARMLGVRPSNLPVGLPEPAVKHLRRRPLWLASEVREFASARSGAKI